MLERLERLLPYIFGAIVLLLALSLILAFVAFVEILTAAF